MRFLRAHFTSGRSQRTIAVLALLCLLPLARSQGLPNPYPSVDGWAELPAGRPMGTVVDLQPDPDGKHPRVIVRCTATEPKQFGSECLGSTLDPGLQLDLEPDVVKRIGGGRFIWPHGLALERAGNVFGGEPSDRRIETYVRVRP